MSNWRKVKKKNYDKGKGTKKGGEESYQPTKSVLGKIVGRMLTPASNIRYC